MRANVPNALGRSNWLTMKPLPREIFKQKVFERDNQNCVSCFDPAVDAHHLIERRLWSDGGYYLDNGVSLCAVCHLRAEATLRGYNAHNLRSITGITKILLPECLEKDNVYDKWGNVILSDGKRLRGPLFYDKSVQKVLTSVLDQFSKYVKYPRTPYLPWSQDADYDYKSSFNCNADEKIIITEKMDGENTTLYDDFIHARSLDGDYHWTRTWVKNYWSKNIAYQIPDNTRICGENMYATHSIYYNNLPSFFLGFSMWEDGMCLSWEETLYNFEILGVDSVPVLDILHAGELEEWSKKWKDTDNCEGYVVRLAESYTANNFRGSIGKYVRPNHIQTRKHWLKGSIEQNKLK